MLQKKCVDVRSVTGEEAVADRLSLKAGVLPRNHVPNGDDASGPASYLGLIKS